MNAVTVDGGFERHDPSSLQDVLVAALDQIDYPMVLVTEHARIVHANRAAIEAFAAPDGPFTLRGGMLVTQDGSNESRLRRGLGQVLERGLRDTWTPVAASSRGERMVAAMSVQPSGSPRIALITLSRSRICQVLSVEGYARCHKLTAAETRVLQALCDGAQPREIAEEHGVRLSTVRAQIRMLLSKSGTRSLAELLRVMATLPPVIGVAGVHLERRPLHRDDPGRPAAAA